MRADLAILVLVAVIDQLSAQYPNPMQDYIPGDIPFLGSNNMLSTFLPSFGPGNGVDQPGFSFSGLVNRPGGRFPAFGSGPVSGNPIDFISQGISAMSNLVDPAQQAALSLFNGNPLSGYLNGQVSNSNPDTSNMNYPAASGRPIDSQNSFLPNNQFPSAYFNPIPNSYNFNEEGSASPVVPANMLPGTQQTRIWRNRNAHINGNGKPDDSLEEAPNNRPEGTPNGRPAGTHNGRPEGTPNGPPAGTPNGPPERTPNGPPAGTPNGPQEGRPNGHPKPDVVLSRRRRSIPVQVPNGVRGAGPNGHSENTPNGPPEETHNGRPEGTPNGRPEGTPNGPQGGRPNGRPAGTPNGPQGGRPNGPQGGRPNGPQAGRPNGPQGGRPNGPQGGRPNGPQGQIPSTGRFRVPVQAPNGVPGVGPNEHPENTPNTSPEGISVASEHFPHNKVPANVVNRFSA